MSKIILFAQHIRTSSKARRGFRTFKRTLSVINDQMDEILGTYGVYTPTQYQNFQEMEPEDYPKLFMFYRLDSYRVLCRSTYVGEDLHSFPPRTGNYISHALVCSDVERYNPIEVFLEAGWMNIDTIKKEDNVAGVDMNIQKLQLELHNDYDDFNEHFKKLFFSNSGRKEKRIIMFMHAVDAIILRKRIIIVDERNSLQYWMFSLLYVFPEELIFKYLDIASFFNSNLLMDICNVLCFEPENLEKIKLHNDYKRWDVIDGNAQHQPSIYAEVLMKCILQEEQKDFRAFKKEVFEEFRVTSRFTMDEFNKYARFFDEIHKINKMSAAEFEGFLTLYLKEEAKVQAIFKEIQSKEIWDKILLFWKSLFNGRYVNDFHYFKLIFDNFAANVPERYWLEFEREVIPRVEFSGEIEMLIRYYQLLNNEDSERLVVYYPKIDQILQQIENPEKARTSIRKILDTVRSLDEPQKTKLKAKEKFIDVCQQIKSVDKYEGIIFMYGHRDIFNDENARRGISKLIGHVSWDTLFKLIKEGRSDCLQYLQHSVPNVLPDNKELISILYNNRYQEEQPETYRLYSTLSEQERIEFIKHSPDALKKIILDKISVQSVSILEKILDIYNGIVQEKMIVEKFLIDIEMHEDLWHLCYILLEGPDHIQNSALYPNIIRLGESSRKMVFSAIDDISVEISSKYIRVAELLSRKKLISRNVPKSHLEFTYDDLRSIGSLNELRDIRRKIKGRAFTEDDLRKLIKPPWEYFCWAELFEHLKDEDKKEIPKMIHNILSEYKKEDEVHYRKWYFITCEFFIYLISIDNMEEFHALVTQLFQLNWESYDFITNRLLYIMPAENSTYEYYKKHDSKSRWTNRGPSWTPLQR
jgi:hypothetical protein